MIVPAVLPAGRFFDQLLAANQPRLAGFQRWLLHPGMLFRSQFQWWGPMKPRANPHEGLDLCWFQDAAGRTRALDHNTLIPAPFAGSVVKISADFLGQSIFLAHPLMPAPGRRLYTAFGHTTLAAGLAVGQSILAGEIVAAVAAPLNRKTAVPPHLHITLALIPEAFGPDQLTWSTLGADPAIVLLDPLAVFSTAWIVLAENGQS